MTQLQVLLGAALERIRELEQRNAQLEQRNAQLEAELERLRARLNQNSTNSSRPPSTDPPWVRREVRRQPSGKRPGGQPGHEKHERALVALEQVSRVVEVVAERCSQCQHPLSGPPQALERYQVTEIEPIVTQVTEYQCHTLKCPQCGERTTAELPVEAQSAFGERLGALVCLLMGMYRLSQRQVQSLLEQVLGVDLSLGMVSKLSLEMSQALEQPMRQAEAFIREQEALNADETGWREGIRQHHAVRAWLWVFAALQVVVFRIALSRGRQVLEDVLGTACTAFLTSDRWGAYDRYDLGLRQLCWSHLLRDFRNWAQQEGPAGQVGRALVEQGQRLFHLWHQFQQGAISRKTLQSLMRPIEQQVHRLLLQARRCAALARKAQRILKRQKALWSFEQVPGVEPSNNFAERLLRHGVLWRKSSGGTRSDAGSRFVERILSVVMSLRLQRRAVLPWLLQALLAFRRGQAPPSLLPEPTL